MFIFTFNDLLGCIAFGICLLALIISHFIIKLKEYRKSRKVQRDAKIHSASDYGEMVKR